MSINNIRISPSRFAAMMTNGRKKDEPGQTFYSLAETIAMEAIGVEMEQITTREMQWGIDYEPFAIAAYEAIYNVVVTPCVKRIQAPEKEFAFVTGEPDGLIGSDFLIEVKCPNQANHLKNLRNGEQVKLYYDQMQGYMWLTGREWCNFVSYHPNFPEHLQLAVYPVERDEERIEQIKERCLLLYAEVQKIIEELNKHYKK